ncbi:anti-phage dCTP deaminase [Enterobacter sp. 22503]|uniref:anti-phage dCTP deaminase n=1 Tax=unclassified Enterobacter TaxID=2608935 RepID=UPI003F858455
MATNAAKKIYIPSIASSENSSSSDTINTLVQRQSNELVIAFCGPIGAGIKSVRLAFEKNLNDMGYDVKHIHISSLMDSIEKKNLQYKNSYERYIKRQDQGNELRHKYSSQVLAEAAIYEMARIKQLAKSSEEENQKFNGKYAYLIDQLKNPAEVELLRLVYQHNFYLIGVVRNESERKRNLRDEDIIPQHIDDLIHRDRKSGGNSGQQVEKTILDSDFFIRNNQSHVTQLNEKVKRFLGLIHGKNGLTPTLHEKGMFNAFSASLQSACLSRQVGAAIVDNHGNILSTGRNDVPKFGGGLYTFEDDTKDYRCIHKGGKCYNDLHKNKIKERIYSEIKSNLLSLLGNDFLGESQSLIVQKIISDTFVEVLTNKIYENSPIKSLTEYSRAIHAEMDAITTLARTGDASTENKDMYTTTYPCHNCARHIVACGIRRVYYIEPYEKSLALDLHDDAISDSNSSESNKVIFIQFEGVSPRRYSKFFFSTADRKNGKGIAFEFSTKYKKHVDIQFLDSYQEMEDKVSQIFLEKVMQQDS